jgi:hypothetical protein
VSNVAINAVRESDLAPAGLRLVALILADAAGRDDGGSLFLSMQSIANRCALTKGHTRRLVNELVGQGLLSIVREGSGPQDTNDYQLDLDAFRRRRASWAIADERRRALREKTGQSTSIGSASSAAAASTGASIRSMDASDRCTGASIRGMDASDRCTGASQSQGNPPTPREGGNTLGRNRTPPARRAGAGAPADTGRSRARNPAAAKIDFNAPRDRDWLGLLS